MIILLKDWFYGQYSTVNPIDQTDVLVQSTKAPLHSIPYIPPKAPSGGPRRFCGVMTRGGAAFGVFQLNNRCVRHGLDEAVSLDSSGICGVSWVL